MKHSPVVSLILVSGSMIAACTILETGVDPTYQPPAEIQSALESALVHVREHYPETAPPSGLQWAGTNTTPRNLVGSVTYAFEADAWQVTITHAVVAPEYVEYQVEIQNTESGFNWAGTVKPDGQVIDTNLEATPETTESGFLVEGADFGGFVFSAEWAEAQQFYRAEGESFWTPTQSDILALEESLEDAILPYAETQGYPDLDQRLPDYLRQYIGVVVDEQRLVFAALFCNDYGFDWQMELILWNIDDGGICNIDLSYDPETDEFLWLSIHGEA